MIKDILNNVLIEDEKYDLESDFCEVIETKGNYTTVKLTHRPGTFTDCMIIGTYKPVKGDKGIVRRIGSVGNLFFVPLYSTKIGNKSLDEIRSYNGSSAESMRLNTKIELLTIHTTAGSKNATVNDIRQLHMQPEPQGRGWPDIGYHWVVYNDGTLNPGRDERYVGSHVGNENLNNIGIVWCGGLNYNEVMSYQSLKDKNIMSEVQWNALPEHVAWLLLRYNLTLEQLRGHNNFGNVWRKKDGSLDGGWKTCPLFGVFSNSGRNAKGQTWNVTRDILFATMVNDYFTGKTKMRFH